MIGQTLTHYKILEKIGSGGMGDVYLADDTKLDRKVALKVLPPELAESEERRARFQREAKAIAALDHPNIVQVFSVEEAEGIHFITMQLVHGKTLTELLPNNGFPLNKFFDIAIPLADAVAAAHQEAITHRDLKPDNVMVSDDGGVKVLDFGLAKPMGGLASDPGNSDVPTEHKTKEGRILGTVAYMSPEQAEGKPVDTLTDIFSLGIVFYEMLTGNRPFFGETPAAILSSILKDEPVRLRDKNPDVPRELSKLVGRCLSKDKTRRFQSALDIRNELEELRSEVDSPESAVVTPVLRRGLWAGWLAAGAMGLLVGILATRTDAPVRSQIPRLTKPVQLTTAVGVEDYPTWSPDGQTLAYSAVSKVTSPARGTWDIWVAQVKGGQPVNRTADHPGANRCPSWSPDGSQIAFWSDRDGAGYFVMSALGGTARKVISSATDQPSPPQWSPDAKQLAGVVEDSAGLQVEILSLDSRESRRVSLPGRRSGRIDLSWSHDGRFFAYVDAVGHGNDVTTLRVLRISDGESFDITDGLGAAYSPDWSRTGPTTLFYVSNRGGGMELWQQELNDDGTPRGSAIEVTVGIGIRRAAFSRGGDRLAYSRGRLVANVWRVPLFDDRAAGWTDAEQLTFDSASIESLDLSPDGKLLLLNSDRAGNHDVWSLPLVGGELTPVTTDAAPDWDPSWSPDQQQIVFTSYRSANREIWIVPASSGPARQLTDGQSEGKEFWGPSWSPDGHEIAFSSPMTGDASEIWIVPSGGGEPRLVTIAESRLGSPEWSPDGDWLLFGSGQGLQRIPAAGGDPLVVTESTGGYGWWSKDGAHVIFLKPQQIWSASLQDGSERILVDFTGQHVTLGFSGLAVDKDFLYYTLVEDVGDIWVMDVVTDEDS